MYCLFCGSNLSEEAIFCPKCGKPTPKGISESKELKTAASSTLPSDPYNPRPVTYYGPPHPEAGEQSTYVSPNPYALLTPPPPPQRRFSPGVLKGLVSSILVVLLLGGGLGGWLLLKQGTASPSVSHPLKPIAASQPTIQSASKSTATPQPTSTTAQSLPGTWIQCAVENATCSFSGLMTVAFGAKDSFHYTTKSNGTACTDTIFGDPIFGTSKACYLIAPPTSAAKWIACATENNTCSFTGKHEVAYGANGEYSYGIFTSGTVCSNNVFGDPAANVVKACYYQ